MSINLDAQQLGFVARSGDYSGRFERAIIGIYKGWLREGDTALDGGASDGWHTWGCSAAVGHTGRVVSVEPIPAKADKIVEVASMMGKVEVEVVRAALSNKSGEAVLHVGENTGLSSLHDHSWLHGASHDIVVSLITIDSLADRFEKLKFIKLDLEGHELFALAGGRETLARKRPLVVFECGYANSLASVGRSAGDLWSFWSSLGYRLCDLSGFPIDLEVLEAPGVENILAQNVVAFPAESECEAFLQQRIPFVIANVESFY